jgi:hypothetical protein
MQKFFLLVSVNTHHTAMSGYQVQTPKFFVGLDPINNVYNNLTMLNSTVNKLPQHLYATGPIAAADIIGSLITFTGTAASFTAALPNNAAVLAAVQQVNKNLMGNAIINVPATQREAMTAPKVGFSWSFYMMNDSGDDVTLSSAGLDFQASSNVVFSGEFAVFKGMLTSNNHVVISRCCEHLQG